MHQSTKSNRYSDFLRGKFLRYALGIIAVMFAVFMVFMLFNVWFATVLGTQNKTSEISRFLETTFGNLDAELEQLAQDTDIQATLLGSRGALQASTQKLYAFSNSQPLASTFLLATVEGDILSTSLYRNNYIWFQSSQLSKTIIKKLEDEPHKTYHAVSQLDYGYDQNGDYLFARAVLGPSGKVIGFLVVDIKDTALYNHMLSYNLDQITITDRFDNIVFSTQRIVADPMEKYPTGRYRLEWNGRWTAQQNGKAYYVVQQPVYSGELRAYGLASVEFQIQMFAYGSLFLVATGLLLVEIVSHMIRYTTRRNLASIEELAQAARRIGEGDLSYRITTRSFDEFEVLGDALNFLTENLQTMIRHNQELAEHQRILELKQLENQFNPHFIFNTMEAIRYKILLEPQSASEMVFTFANLMRYSMNFGSNTVPFSTDVSFLQDYLMLQKIRFNDRLHYSVDIEPELLDYHLPKLMLQPIVENSLNHGTRHKRGITVTITGHCNENDILLEVKDDGDGIPPEKLAELRAYLSKGEDNSPHFGLYSVHRTIQLVYGSQYGLAVSSNSGEGTVVQIHLPKRGEQHVSSSDC